MLISYPDLLNLRLGRSGYEISGMLRLQASCFPALAKEMQRRPATGQYTWENQNERLGTNLGIVDQSKPKKI